MAGKRDRELDSDELEEEARSSSIPRHASATSISGASLPSDPHALQLLIHFKSPNAENMNCSRNPNAENVNCSNSYRISNIFSLKSNSFASSSRSDCSSRPANSKKPASHSSALLRPV